MLNFDGESFWTALLRAADISHDPATVAAVYADLAIETATRSGMWKGRPDDDVVDGWIEQALALAPPGSAARAKALAASSYFHAGAEQAAAEAFDIAERLGDQELRSFAVDGLTATAIAARKYDEAYEWARTRLRIARGIGDPDHLAEAHLSAICAYLAVGRIREARDLARKLEEVSAELTPHHRLHAVGYALLIDVVEGRWDTVRALAQPTEQAVVANEATPCVLNAWSLVACATALCTRPKTRRSRGGSSKAPLECRSRRASSRCGPGQPRLGARESRHGRRAPAGRSSPSRRPAILGRLSGARTSRRPGRPPRSGANRAGSPCSLGPGTYFEPFALRALGIVRRDSGLIEQALSRFEAMELGWHAERTSGLLAAR